LKIYQAAPGTHIPHNEQPVRVHRPRSSCRLLCSHNRRISGISTGDYFGNLCGKRRGNKSRNLHHSACNTASSDHSNAHGNPLIMIPGPYLSCRNHRVSGISSGVIIRSVQSHGVHCDPSGYKIIEMSIDPSPSPASGRCTCKRSASPIVTRSSTIPGRVLPSLSDTWIVSILTHHIIDTQPKYIKPPTNPPTTRSTA